MTEYCKQWVWWIAGGGLAMMRLKQIVMTFIDARLSHDVDDS